VILQCGVRGLDLSVPRVMGVINLTPDSFSDGGSLWQDGRPAADRVLRRAERMLADGADILDLGGESTRPGAAPVSVQEECDRVLPALEAIAARLDVIVSVDTSTPEVIRAAAAAGAGLLNDVRSLARPGAMAAAAATGLPVCLMHMRGEPATMQKEPVYRDVCAEVREFLLERVSDCESAGIPRRLLLLDPGFGFGKTLEHNLELFRGLPGLVGLGLPVLIGVSRKSMIGRILGRDTRQRLAGGLALATLAAQQGVAVVRTHDVRATRDVLAMVAAVRKEG
jgi:dihydropteroate synthase